jgi:hypothetical protein
MVVASSWVELEKPLARKLWSCAGAMEDRRRKENSIAVKLKISSHGHG